MDFGEIYGLLRQLGLPADNSRFFHVSYAVYLTVRQPFRTLFAEWWLYPAVAQRYHACNRNVKYSICFAADLIWQTEKETLMSITKYPLEHKPLPSEFIAILAAYFNKSCQEFSHLYRW